MPIVKWWKEVWETVVFCWREKLRAVTIFWVMAGTTYFIIPKILVFEADTTPFYHIDREIPFLSWTVAIYLTLYAQVTLAFFLVRSRAVLRRLFGAYMLGGLILGLCYYFLPTTHNYPSPVAECRNCFDHAVLWVRAKDVAANQFPSGHALFSLLAPFLFLSAGRYRLGIPFMLWGALIAVSTLTVKQHNLVDVVAGGFLAMAIGYLFGMSCPRKD